MRHIFRRSGSLFVCAAFALTAVAASRDAQSPGHRARLGHVEKSGTGPTNLILVPCLGCDWRAWDEFMARSGDLYTMYAVTWPGMGETPLPDVPEDPRGTALMDYLDEAFASLIREESIARPVLIGHSAAAPFVVRFAHRYADLVRAVVSVDATITNGSILGYTREQRLEWARNEMADVRAQYDNDEGWLKLNAPPKLPDEARSRLYGRMWLLPPRQNVLRYWAEWLRIDAGTLVQGFPHPLLALYAIRPSDQTPDDTKETWRRRFRENGSSPNVRIAFIEKAGHSIWEFQPEAFDRVIREFVASLDH